MRYFVTQTWFVKIKYKFPLNMKELSIEDRLKKNHKNSCLYKKIVYFLQSDIKNM